MKKYLSATSAKKLTLLGLAGTLFISVAATISAAGASVKAATVPFNGNHYTALLPTQTTYGCKEYWIDCTTHEISLEKPSNASYIGEGGVGQPISDENDIRYYTIVDATKDIINEAKQSDDPDIVEEAKEYIENNCGVVLDDTFTKIESIDETYNNITIPEGVTDVVYNSNHDWNILFDGLDSLETVYISGSVDIIPYGWSIQNCPNLKTVTIGAKKLQGNEIIKNCPNIQTINMLDTIKTIEGSDGCFSQLGNYTVIINCELSSQPEYKKVKGNEYVGWQNKWNNYDWANKFQTNWDIGYKG